ncbi:hypothetical protein HanPI659440_Chr07g0258881 [Helianthus annuus]|nr:hypothetical protein HanPI659440_Chr07g0258881 [Helianthus annuus]
MNSNITKGYRVSVPVSNLLNRVCFPYRFGTGIHRFLPSNTGAVSVPTSIEPYRTMYILYWYPLLGISVTVFSVPVGTDLIKSCSNVAMQVIVPFRLLFIHRVSDLLKFLIWEIASLPLRWRMVVIIGSGRER